MFLRHRVVFSILILTFGLHIASSETITVPTDASTVKEAVELAQSGDTIFIDAVGSRWDGTDWGGEIIIRDKDITITGRSPDQQAWIRCGELNRGDPLWYEDEPLKTLLIENGSLVLQNLRIGMPCLYSFITHSQSYQAGTPIVVRDGNLTLRDSSLCISHLIVQGSCEIERCELSYYGHKYATHGGPWELADAALVLGPADDAEIVIRGARIEGLRLDELSDSTVTGRDCEIIEVIRGSGWGWAPLRASPGEHAVFVRSCTDTVLDFSNCVLQASPGGWSGKGMDGVRDHYGGVGGDGLHVQDSTLEIRGGDYRGGEGAYGYLLWFEGSSYEAYSNGGPGGDGIELVRSHVRYRDCIFTRGPGGESTEKTINGETRSVEGGQDGLDIRLDEFSTLQPVSTAECGADYR